MTQVHSHVNFGPSTRASAGRALFFIFLALSLLVGCGDDGESGNKPPLLTLDVGATASYTVGEVIQIRASAEDPDGDSLEFSVVDLPERAELHTYSNSALMTWDPIASDVTGEEPLRLVFVVEDGRGGRAERVVNLTISASNAGPVFSTPSSRLFDPAKTQTLKFEVKVRADAAREVGLSMPDEGAPEGAQFEQTGPKTGEFSWTPDADQRERRVHAVSFIADDHENPAVTQKVTIILQRSNDDPGGGPSPSPSPGDGDLCDADRPITHGSPGPQRTLEDYELRAHLSESAAERYDAGYIFWSTVDPMNYEVEFEAVEMKVGRGLMRGGIPNQLLLGQESQTIYYTICALDTEADLSDEDAFICAPADYYYSFVAYPPDTAQCASDLGDGSAGGSFSGAAQISDLAWETHSSCGGKTYHQISVPAGELAEVYLLYSFEEVSESGETTNPLKVRVFDGAQTPREVERVELDCEGLIYLEMPGATGSAQDWYIEVESQNGAELPYQITAFTSDDPQDPDPPGSCVDDDLFGDQNRDAESAEELWSDTFEELTVCADQSDWYYAWIDQGDSVFLELAVDDGPSLNDIFLSVYNLSGEWVDEALVEGDKLELIFTAPEGSFYYFEVYSAQDAQYQLGFLSETDS